MIGIIKSKNLKNIFIFIVTILAVLGAIYILIMQYHIESEKKIGASINISGKQRMISQKILAFSQIYVYQSNLRKQARYELKKLKTEINQANTDLINGNDQLNSALEYDEIFHSIYFSSPLHVNKKLKAYIEEIDKLLNDPKENLDFTNVHLQHIQEQAAPLLIALDKAVKAYEQVAQNQVELKVTIRFVMFGLSLVFLYVLAKFILMPLNSVIKQREEELKEREQFLNMIIESNQQAIIAIDHNSNVIIFNNTAEKIFGYTKDEMIGKDSLCKIIPEEFLEAHNTASRFFMEGGESKGIVKYSHKLSAKRSNGHIFPVEIGFGADSFNGEQVVVANISDISEDVKSLEKIQSLNKKLERSLEAEKLFLSSMSHEIRTPLNSIIGFLKLLDEMHIEGKAGQWIQNANISSKHLLTLINDILDLSKISANQMELACERLDLIKILEDTMVIVSTRLAENVSLKLETCQVEHYVQGDSSRIKQILLNLLGNATKFTTKGSIVLELESFNIYEDNKVRVSILVHDTGKGIPTDKIDHIFSAYKQSSTTDSGTGLGLYISKSLVSLLGGELSVVSELGKGTTFSMTLDLLLDDLIDNNNDYKSDITTTSDFSYLNVLMAEDVEMNILLAKTIFSEYFNISLDIAKNGHEAVKKLQSNSYDIVFMDINMPKMDGIEATKQIRLFNKQTPIIALTANAFSEDKNSAFKAGMNDYVTKPIVPEKLQQVLISNTTHQEQNTSSKINFDDENETIQSDMSSSVLESIAQDIKLPMPIVIKLVSAFIPSTQKQLEHFDIVIKQDDAEEIRKAAHAVSGTSKNMRLHKIGDIAQQIELLAGDGKIDECRQLYDKLAPKVKEVLQELELGLKATQ